MTPRDWTLLVIAAAEGKTLQPVQLQKALFLLGKRLTPQQRQTHEFYEFTAYDYGPFDSTIYTDAESLEAEGLIAITRPPVSRYKLYQATEEGLKRAAEVRAGLQPLAVEYVAKVVQVVRALSFNDLVSAIYKAYPEMRENSVFKEA